MLLKTFLTTAAAAGLLALGATAARAADAPPNMPQGKEWCEQNPDRCAEMRARREQWCQQNPEQCQRIEQRRADRQAWCDQNPEECAARREQMRKRMEQRRAERQAWCEQNPAECAKQREERRQRMEERRAQCEADPASCEPMKRKHGGKGRMPL